MSHQAAPYISPPASDNPLAALAGPETRTADPTQSLLRWGIENAAPGSLLPLAEDIKAGKRPDLNTDMLKALMGTTDADRMKECVEVIQGRWVDRDDGGVKDKDVTIEDKLRAWDDLEMVRS